MPRGENVHLRKDGRWEARYVKERDFGGRAVYGFCYGTSREEALRKARAARQPAGRPISRLLDEWLEERSGQVKASSLASYRTVAEKYIRPRLGDRYPDEMDAPALEAFRRELLEKDGLSAARVRVVLFVLRGALESAGQPCPQVRGKAAVPCTDVPQSPRVLSEAEQLRLMTCLQLDMDACKFGILLALSTGLRIGELCALRWENISLREQTLRVVGTMQRLRQAEGGTQVVVGDPMNAASARTIPLTAKVTALCRKMHPRDPEAYVLTGTRAYMDPRTAQRRLKRYADFCGLGDVSFGTLRDTFATRCAEAGLDLGSLCEIMGYSSVRSVPPALLHATAAPSRARVQLLEEAGL